MIAYEFVIWLTVRVNKYILVIISANSISSSNQFNLF